MTFKSKAQAKAFFAEKKWIKNGKASKITEVAEVTSGVKAPTPEVTTGVKSPTPTVTSGLDKSKTVGSAKVEVKKLDNGEAKVKPETTSGVKAPTTEVKTGSNPEKKPEVTSLKKEGVEAPKELRKEIDSKNENPILPSTGVVDEKMDEASEVKHKSLEEKAKALKAEIESLEKEMSGVKELGIKKFTHNTKKEEVAKLGEEIKTLKEKSRDPMKLPVPDRDGNKHMPKPTQNIPSKKWKSKKNRKGWKNDMKKGLDEKVKTLSEGFSSSYVSKASRKNLISERVLATYWEKAIKLQEESGEHRNKSNKSFWYGVVKNFDGLLNEQELVKAKQIMTEREKFNLNTEKFINCLASDNYVKASDYMNSMVEAALNNLIDTSKVQYQKELGEKVSKKLREV